jgi:hypothetical protein
VHLIRHSLKYVPRRQYDQVTKDLKPIYTATDVDSAQEALERFEQKWGAQLPPVVKAWWENWEYVIPFLAFPPDVRRVIYTTDESVKAAVQFQGSCWSRSLVLVAEVGVCEDVARRQGRRRNRVGMGLVTRCGCARSSPPGDAVGRTWGRGLGLAQGVVDPRAKRRFRD